VFREPGYSLPDERFAFAHLAIRIREIGVKR
jgi:hypothetical protein